LLWQIEEKKPWTNLDSQAFTRSKEKNHWLATGLPTNCAIKIFTAMPSHRNKKLKTKKQNKEKMKTVSLRLYNIIKIYYQRTRTLRIKTIISMKKIHKKPKTKKIKSSKEIPFSWLYYIIRFLTLTRRKHFK